MFKWPKSIFWPHWSDLIFCKVVWTNQIFYIIYHLLKLVMYLLSEWWGLFLITNTTNQLAVQVQLWPRCFQIWLHICPLALTSDRSDHGLQACPIRALWMDSNGPRRGHVTPLLRVLSSVQQLLLTWTTNKIKYCFFLILYSTLAQFVISRHILIIIISTSGEITLQFKFTSWGSSGCFEFKHWALMLF